MYYPIDKYIIIMYNGHCQEAKAAARKETSLREKVQAPGTAAISNNMEVTP